MFIPFSYFVFLCIWYMSGRYPANMSSLNSSEASSLTSSSDPSGSTEKKSFSLLSPSTWSAPSFSNIFKEETCEEKKDKTINAATKTIEKAKADYTACATKRSTGAKPAAASTGSMFSFLGFGSKPEAPAASTGSMFSFLGFGSKPQTPTAAKIGGRKKSQKKQKKTKKGKTNRRRK